MYSTNIVGLIGSAATMCYIQHSLLLQVDVSQHNEEMDRLYELGGKVR